MRESAEVRNALLFFYDRVSAGDVASFDLAVSSDPAALVIGTAPGEWVSERERLRFGFEAEGLTVTPGDPKGYEDGGTLGWVVDEPRFGLPDGSAMRCRLTGVTHKESDRWKILHLHWSVGVPDEEVVALQQRWGIS